MDFQRPTLAVGKAIAAAVVVAVPGSVLTLPEISRPTSPVALRVTPAALDFCRRAAYLLHDVTWATACEMRGEEEIDCTLPDGIAAKLNLILVNEERRCLAIEARAPG